jgi:hypothetical protein
LLVFGPCILNLFVKFVSSRLEFINLQMPLMEIKQPTIAVPSHSSLMGNPDAAGPFIAPCQQQAVTEQTSLSPSLTAVRATIERGD